jgi:hypothetical protein
MNLARAAYHEQSLRHGLDDCFSEWGERPGPWWGGGAELLGLEGYAVPGSIVSLIEGRDPASGDLLRRPTSGAFVTRRVFDPESGGLVERQVEQKAGGVTRGGMIYAEFAAAQLAEAEGVKRRAQLGDGRAHRRRAS